MATVSDRAQLLLTGGLAVAVSLVVIALVLNSAIYTENLATRNGDVDANGGVSFAQDVRTDGGSILYTVNREPPFGYTSLNTRYGLALNDWASVRSRTAARNGHSISISRAGAEFGTRIADDGSVDPAFVPASGSSGLGNALGGAYSDEWAVVVDAKIRAFSMTVDSPPGVSPGDPLSAGTIPFFVEVRDSTGPERWQIVPYDDGSELGVFVYEADSSTVVGSCTHSVSGSVTFDVTAGEVEGEACPALSFVGTLDGTQEVYFNEGDSGEGSYELVADRRVDSASASATGALESAVDERNHASRCNGPTYDETAGGEPYAVPAVYDDDVDTTYRTEQVTYENEVRIAPGEPGDRTRAPRFNQISARDVSGSGDAEFDVTFNVEDPNGDSLSVTVELIDATGMVVDSVSGPGTLFESGGENDDYRIAFTVSETAGPNSRTVTEFHEADGDGTGDGSCPE